MGRLSQALSGTLGKFFRETSITGVNRASRSASWFRWSYWMLIFLGLTYLTINGLVRVFVDYFSYPHITNTDFVYQDVIPFPAVTFCSLNRAHCENLLEETLQIRRRIASTSDLEQREALEEQLEIVNEIFEVDSGCRITVCQDMRSEAAVESASSNMPPKVEGATQMWWEAKAALIMHEIQCPYLDVHATMNLPICIHLLYLYDLVNMDSPTLKVNITEIKSDSLSAFRDTFRCSLAPTCQHLTELLEEDSDGKAKPTESCLAYMEDPNEAEEIDSNVTAFVPSLRGNPNKVVDEASFTKRYLQLSTEFRQNVGHRRSTYYSITEEKIHGFMDQCFFQGRDCLHDKYWTQYTSSAYGNCYVFNSHHNENRSLAGYPLQVSLTGIEHGLTVSFTVDQFHYMGNKLSKKAGVRAVIHDPEVMPNPVDEGFDLQPNTASSISLQRIVMDKLPAPFNASCINFWNETTNYQHLDNSSVKYTFSTCQGYCLQMEIVNTCDCYHPRLTQYGLEETSSGEPCLIYESGQGGDTECARKVFQWKNEGDWTCPCHMECKHVGFSKTQNLGLDLGYSEEDIFGPEAAEIKARIAANVLQANVYFQTTEVKKIAQSVKYSGNALWSSIGGALSIYLGMALVMIFEVFELLGDVALTLLLFYGSEKQ